MKNGFFKVLFLVILVISSLGVINGQANCECTDTPNQTWGSNNSVTNLSSVVPSGNLTGVCVAVYGILNIDINLNFNGVTLLMQSGSEMRVTKTSAVQIQFNYSKIKACGLWEGIVLHNFKTE